MGERNALAFIGPSNQIVWEPRFSSWLIQIMINKCPDAAPYRPEAPVRVGPTTAYRRTG